MTIVRIERPWVDSSKIAKMTDEQYETLRQLSNAPEDRTRATYVEVNDLLDFEEDIPMLISLGIHPTIKHIKSVRAFAEEFRRGYAPQEAVEAGAVHVHLSDSDLLRIREVDLLGDACTDELRDWLSRGWVILAIIPQPGQRRPDYILGRTAAARREHES